MVRITVFQIGGGRRAVTPPVATNSSLKASLRFLSYTAQAQRNTSRQQTDK
jgi:hypothetical protein